MMTVMIKRRGVGGGSHEDCGDGGGGGGGGERDKNDILIRRESCLTSQEKTELHEITSSWKTFHLMHSR